MLHLGTNDVFQCVPLDTTLKYLAITIEVLREKNANMLVFLAKILPLGNQWNEKKLCGPDYTYGQSLTRLNERIAAFATSATISNSPIVLVDQNSGIDTSADLYDDMHPNEGGQIKMARKWFAAIHKYLRKLKP